MDLAGGHKPELLSYVMVEDGAEWNAGTGGEIDAMIGRFNDSVGSTVNMKRSFSSGPSKLSNGIGHR
ncbi:unnamed protein product [Penicillium palitans]